MPDTVVSGIIFVCGSAFYMSAVPHKIFVYFEQ